jgi:hypothetical protein
MFAIEVNGTVVVIGEIAATNSYFLLFLSSSIYV